MSGLASRWATDESLVEDAKTQDASSHSIRSKWSTENTAKPIIEKPKPVTSPVKSGKLQSKWDIEEEPPIQKSEKKHHPKKPFEPKNNHNHSLTPKEKKPVPKYNNESDDDELPPMTEGAKSLAARLGIVDNSTTQKPRRQQDSGKSMDKPIAKQTVKPKGKSIEKPISEDEGFVTTDDETDEELPPMTDGAKQLAARLGMITTDTPKTKPAPKPKSKPVPKPASKQSPKPKQSTSQSQYLTPRQKHLEKQLADDNAKIEAEKLKVQLEIDRIVKEMDDSKLSWADLE